MNCHTHQSPHPTATRHRLQAQAGPLRTRPGLRAHLSVPPRPRGPGPGAPRNADARHRTARARHSRWFQQHVEVRSTSSVRAVPPTTTQTKRHSTLTLTHFRCICYSTDRTSSTSLARLSHYSLEDASRDLGPCNFHMLPNVRRTYGCGFRFEVGAAAARVCRRSQFSIIAHQASRGRSWPSLVYARPVAGL